MNGLLDIETGFIRLTLKVKMSPHWNVLWWNQPRKSPATLYIMLIVHRLCLLLFTVDADWRRLLCYYLFHVALMRY